MHASIHQAQDSVGKKALTCNDKLTSNKINVLLRKYGTGICKKFLNTTADHWRFKGKKPPGIICSY